MYKTWGVGKKSIWKWINGILTNSTHSNYWCPRTILSFILGGSGGDLFLPHLLTFLQSTTYSTHLFYITGLSLIHILRRSTASYLPQQQFFIHYNIDKVAYNVHPRQLNLLIFYHDYGMTSVNIFLVKCNAIWQILSEKKRSSQELFTDFAF